jgi:hypothetical protein
MRRSLAFLVLAALVALPASATADDGAVSFTAGRTTFHAVASHTGEQMIPPMFAACDVVGASLDLQSMQWGTLEVTEACFGGGFVRTQVFDIKVTPGGAVKIWHPAAAFEGMMVATGCDVFQGSFPVYHGHFDGTTLRAESYWHDVCDGGFVWDGAPPWFGMYPDWGAIDASTGPVHVLHGITLHVE